MYYLRLIVVVVLYVAGIASGFIGAKMALEKEVFDVADYLMLTVACMMFGSLIHKVKATNKDESTPNG